VPSRIIGSTDLTGFFLSGLDHIVGAQRHPVTCYQIAVSRDRDVTGGKSVHLSRRSTILSPPNQRWAKQFWLRRWLS